MSGSLAPVRAKLRRANEHRQAFHDLVADYLDPNPYSLSVQYDPETGWHDLIWHVDGAPIPSDDFALIFGDFLTNLRATLDYLVWQLVLVNGGTPTDHTAFPILKKSGGWLAVCGNQLRGVNQTWIDEIEKLQPYNGGSRPEIHPLAILDATNNVNKHRVLPVGVTSLDEFKSWINVEPMAAGDNLDHQMFDLPIEEGAKALTFRWRQTGDRLDVDVDPDPSVLISFPDGLGYPWTQDWLYEQITKIVTIFEPAFPS